MEVKAQESEGTAKTDSVRVCGEIPKGEKSHEVDGEVVVNLYVEDSEDDSTVKPPPTKKSRFHYEEIIMGEMLSDIHVNMAQSVLKSQL